MCGRFSLFHNAEEISRRFGLRRLFGEWRGRYNIAPEQGILIIRDSGGERAAEEAVWGLIPHWAKAPKPMINARADSVWDKPSFRDSKRCLVVADGFYEWQRRGKDKQPYYVTLKGGGLFAFAGLYDDWRGRRTAAIITVEPNGLMRPIHERMPAMLEREDEGKWLSGGGEEALRAALRPYPEGEMAVRAVGRRVNDPGNEGVELISAERGVQQSL
jgi:putative SOS response-associated peptidase YedK